MENNQQVKESNPSQILIDKIATLLEGLTINDAENILDVTKASLRFRSYVQPAKSDR